MKIYRLFSPFAKRALALWLVFYAWFTAAILIHGLHSNRRQIFLSVFISTLLFVGILCVGLFLRYFQTGNKKLLLWLGGIAVFVLCGFQTHTFPALDTLNVFTGANYFKVVMDIRYIDVLNRVGWSGSEAGAWATAAMTDCPSTGCTVLIGTGAFSYSTPIVVSKAGVKLKGQGKSATALNFTGTGIAIKNDAEADSFEDFSLDGSAGPASACLALIDDNGSAAIANGYYANLKLNGCTRDLDMVSSSTSIIWNTFLNIEMRNGGTNGLRLKATTPGFVNENVFINNLIRTAANTGTDALLDGSAGQVAINTFINNDAANQNGVGGIGYSLISAADNSWYGGDYEQDTKGINIDAGSTGNKVFGGETSGCTSPCFFDSTAVGNGNTGLFLTPLGNQFNSILLPATNPSAGARIRWLDAGNAEVDQFVQNNQVRFVNGANQWNFIMSTGGTSQNGPATPTTAGGTDLGNTSLPWANLWIGTAATNNFKITAPAVAAARIITQPDLGVTTSTTAVVQLGNGSTALPTGALGANACATTTTAALTGATTSMHLHWNLATDPSAVTGYSTGAIQIYAWLTAGNVNFKQCSNSALTPGAMSVSWEVFN